MIQNSVNKKASWNIFICYCGKKGILKYNQLTNVIMIINISFYIHLKAILKAKNYHMSSKGFTYNQSFA